MTTTDGLSIGIVGGSITGCGAAIELSRQGHNVSILERSSSALKGRGAGISTTVNFIKQLISRDLIDASFPYVPVNSFAHVGYQRDHPLSGHTCGYAPYPPFAMMQWRDLYNNLYKRLPAGCYHHGCKVSAIDVESDESALLTLEDGKLLPFDLVICADGYSSLGRQMLAPDASLKYRDHILWRGMLEEHRLVDSGLFDGITRRVGFSSGHALFYLVPDLQGRITPGQRLLNWVMYLPVTQEHLGSYLCHSNGHSGYGSVPAGMVLSAQETELKKLARDRLPGIYADIIEQTRNTSIQAIFMSSLPQMRSQRLCVMGDAGFVVPPFTSAGIYKAFANVFGLTKALASHSDLDQALESWNYAETARGKVLLDLAERLEDAVIWSIPDFAEMNQQQMADWWSETGYVDLLAILSEEPQ